MFKALADETRRELLDRLLTHPGQTLSELCADLKMSRQSVSKHLKILQQAELVTVQWRGRNKLHFLNPVPIADIGRRWLDKFSASKMDAIHNLRVAVESTDHSTDHKTDHYRGRDNDDG